MKRFGRCLRWKIRYWWGIRLKNVWRLPSLLQILFRFNQDISLLRIFELNGPLGSSVEGESCGSHFWAFAKGNAPSRLRQRFGGSKGDGDKEIGRFRRWAKNKTATLKVNLGSFDFPTAEIVSGARNSITRRFRRPTPGCPKMLFLIEGRSHHERRKSSSESLPRNVPFIDSEKWPIPIRRQ